MNYIKQRRAWAAFRRAHLKELTLRALGVWDALFDALNDMCWPDGPVRVNKYDLLATFPGSEDTLRRGLEELAALGVIRVTEETERSHAAYEMVQLYEEEAAPEEAYEQGAHPSVSCADTSPQEETEDARRTGAESAQNRRRTAAESGDFCGETAAGEVDAGKILTIDRARAHARKNVNQNVTPNIYAKEKREKAEEETRARRGDTSPALRATSPQGEAGNGQRREAAGAGGETAAGSQERVQTREDAQKRRAADNPEEAGEKRAIDAARACGFSMSKRNREHIAGICREYGAEWTCEAIDRAALRGADKCNVGYVRAILSRWAAAGVPDAADACAGENVNKHASYAANYGGYTHKNDLCRNYNQRTYTPQDDKALFVDLFADENAL